MAVHATEPFAAGSADWLALALDPDWQQQARDHFRTRHAGLTGFDTCDDRAIHSVHWVKRDKCDGEHQQTEADFATLRDAFVEELIAVTQGA